MEISIIIYSVTLTWMFLAYNVKPGTIMKDILYMIVVINAVLNIYVVGAFAEAELLTLTGLYLKISMYLFLVYLFMYVLQFIVDKIRYKKKEEAVKYD